MSAVRLLVMARWMSRFHCADLPWLKLGSVAPAWQGVEAVHVSPVYVTPPIVTGLVVGNMNTPGGRLAAVFQLDLTSGQIEIGERVGIYCRTTVIYADTREIRSEGIGWKLGRKGRAVYKHASAGSDHGPPVAPDVPGNAQTRLKIPQPHLIQGRQRFARPNLFDRRSGRWVYIRIKVAHIVEALFHRRVDLVA